MTTTAGLPAGGQSEGAWARPVRTVAERKAHVLGRLGSEDKLWLATASGGSAHLVPFSYVWDGGRVIMATSTDHRTARNARESGRARVALDSTSDVVIIDGSLDAVEVAEIDDDMADALARASAIDGRKAPGFVYLRLTPRRIQAWWSMAELGAPTIMRRGVWLDDHDQELCDQGKEGDDASDST